jgi:hypothetical protein
VAAVVPYGDEFRGLARSPEGLERLVASGRVAKLEAAEQIFRRRGTAGWVRRSLAPWLAAAAERAPTARDRGSPPRALRPALVGPPGGAGRPGGGSELAGVGTAGEVRRKKSKKGARFPDRMASSSLWRSTLGLVAGGVDGRSSCGPSPRPSPPSAWWRAALTVARRAGRVPDRGRQSATAAVEDRPEAAEETHVKRRRRPNDTADGGEQPIGIAAVAAVNPQESGPPTGHYRRRRGVGEGTGLGEAPGGYAGVRRPPCPPGVEPAAAPATIGQHGEAYPTPGVSTASAHQGGRHRLCIGGMPGLGRRRPEARAPEPGRNDRAP